MTEKEPNLQNDDVWNRPSLLAVDEFEFPYLYKFPGQEKREQILYVTRESKTMLWSRRIGLLFFGGFFIGLTWLVSYWIGDNFFSSSNWQITPLIISLIAVLMIIFLWYWLTVCWKKTIGLVTNYRLVKLVQFNLFNNRSQILPLKEVVDTSAGTKKLWEKIFQVATFTARSSAASSGLATDDASDGRARINKKYFYFENIENAGDLENYVHKVLKLLEEKGPEGMYNFRPFAAKAQAGRRDWLNKNFPQYWS